MTASATHHADLHHHAVAGGGNNVGIDVPEDVVLAFGRGKRVPVVVTVDGGYTYRNTGRADGRAVHDLVQLRDPRRDRTRRR